MTTFKNKKKKIMIEISDTAGGFYWELQCSHTIKLDAHSVCASSSIRNDEHEHV